VEGGNNHVRLGGIGFRPATDRFHAGIDCVVHDFVSTKAKCYQRYRDISPIFPILRATLKSRRFSFEVWHVARILAGIAQVRHAALEALLPEALPRRRAPHFFDKAGHIPVPFALSGKKCFQMPGDNPIQRILFRIARPVDGVDGHKCIALD